MYDIEDMQMLDGQDNLSQVSLRPFFIEVDLLIQHLPKVAARQVLKYEHMTVLLTKREGCFHQMLACDLLEDLMLPLDGF